MRRQPGGDTLGQHLFLGLAKGQRLALGKDIGHQQVVVAAQRVKRPVEADEVARDQLGALVNQLVERVLAVGARLAPVNRAGLVVYRLAGQRDPLAVAFHGQLLQVGREALQVLVVGQHRHRLRTEEVAVPHVEQAHQRRDVAAQRRAVEVVVHGMEAGQQLVEVVGADGQHGGQADGRVHAVAAAYPVPEAEHIGGVDAERCNSFGVGRKRHEMPGNRRFIAQRTEQPGPRCMRVGHGLQRGEGLAGDDEQRLGRVQVVGCLGEIGGVHVADEAKGHVASAVVAQRLVGHDRPQIGAADADVDHVADRLAGVAGPAAAAHLYREGGHALQDIVHLRHHVLAVHEDFGVQRRAQGHV